MKTTIIDITTILSPDLKSRLAVQDLLLYIQNLGFQEVTIDFQNVKFATRSFVDEYYNVFMRTSNSSSIVVHEINVPQDILTILAAVKSTQHKSKNIHAGGTVIRCKNINDVNKMLGALSV